MRAGGRDTHGVTDFGRRVEQRLAHGVTDFGRRVEQRCGGAEARRKEGRKTKI